MLKKLGVLALTALISAQATAHGIYFAERAKQLAVVYGVGADDLDTVARLPKFGAVNGFDEDWDSVDVELTPSGPLLLVTSDDYPVAVSAVLNNGIWSNTGEGHWIGKGRDELPDAILSEETIKYAVHLRGPLRKVPALDDQVLQIVPVGDSFPLMLGEMQTYQVLHKGKPVAGALVKNDFVNDPDAEPVVSDKNGKITLPIRNQGLNVVVATFDAPTDRPKIIDKYELLATLSFVLPHAPE
ncbi:MAG: DUF4198 domain-containing protein [Pseudomonadota bacterium]|mgnify:CR=1 FL=1|jgi:hypothetical protein|uniref:DUF4198 domain-containing protein n=2 Tax=Alteromonas TaxID=226 RepID=A0A2S9VDX4_9ALTE|nr:MULTISPECIES: DUF4198 domain-containing protein [Alteromonas]MBR9790468.1 DUF4198 domain-containing protein [Gammaproteobacteria bacterium]MDY6928191.1 DUF4198 domain-containing protein [Pseudomonadota bacterium]PRO74657.1 DUF4198 domain-containing protein [Alteromonas alba]HBY37881.1 DUF4198 domain-containing protein [Alteromonas sp.]|tara:strand:- start:13656 stop:14381 length:726 start_codon:yes stop_codon:yes gene_type:complete